MHTGRNPQTALEREGGRESRGDKRDTHREMGEVRTEGILRRPEWDTQTIAGMMAKMQWSRSSDESRA